MTERGFAFLPLSLFSLLPLHVSLCALTHFTLYPLQWIKSRVLNPLSRCFGSTVYPVTLHYVTHTLTHTIGL